MLYFQNPILIHQYKIYLEKNAIGKNLQIRGKKMHGLKNDPPISSICSANFFLTPPRLLQQFIAGKTTGKKSHTFSPGKRLFAVNKVKI